MLTRMKKGKKPPNGMTFLEHLEELRKRIFWSFTVLIGAVIPAWFFSKELYNILAQPVTQFLPEGKKLAFTSLTAPFMLYIKVSFLAALFFTSPFIFFQIWMFGVLAFGLSEIFKIPLRRALIISFLFWAIKSLLYIGITMLSMRFMG